MAWRKPTYEDLQGTLSLTEIEAFSQSSDLKDAQEPYTRVIEDAAELVRGFARRLENMGMIRMCPKDYFVPSGWVHPCMDIAAFRLLKRFGIEPTDSRKNAYQQAMDFFQQSVDKQNLPESWEDEEATAEDYSGLVPIYAMEFNPHTLCNHGVGKGRTY